MNARESGAAAANARDPSTTGAGTTGASTTGTSTTSASVTGTSTTGTSATGTSTTGTSTTSTRTEALTPDNPWPGLGAFDEAAHDFFNGREREIEELRRLVFQAPLTVLFSKSGLGKSSLLRAGLFPKIREDNVLPVYVRLDVQRKGRLIDQLKLALIAQLEAVGIEAPAHSPDEPLWHYLHREGLELWSRQNRLVTPLFVLDQFEEVFTLGEENRGPIDELRVDLADLIENRIPAGLAASIESGDATLSRFQLNSAHYRMLLSFREDYLPAVEAWRQQLPSIMRNRLRLLPMDGAVAIEAICKTAPNLVSRNLAKLIVRFVAAAQDKVSETSPETKLFVGLPIEPALLSLVCRGLNEKRREQGKSSFDADLLASASGEIVVDYYRKAVFELPQRVPEFIERELITSRGYRKPCHIDDALMGTSNPRGISREELDLLIDRRLLRIEPYQGRPCVELTHDLLTRVVREERDHRAASAHAEEEKEKAVALALAAREKERVQQRRQRITLAIIASMAVLVLAAGTFAFLFLDAQNQKIAERASTELEVNPQRSVRLALDALSRWGPQPELAELTLRKGLQRMALEVLRPAGPPAGVRAARFSPDARWVATAGEDGVTRLWRLAGAYTGPQARQPGEALAADTGSVVELFPKLPAAGDVRETPVGNGHVGVGVGSVDFNWNGTSVVTVSDDRMVRLWDIASRREIWARPFKWDREGGDRPIMGAEFSPDGSLVISSDRRGVQILEAAAGEVRHTLPVPKEAGEVLAATFVSPRPDDALYSSAGDGYVPLAVTVHRRSRTALVWNARTGTILRVLTPTGDQIGCATFSHDGQFVALGSRDDGKMRIFDLETANAETGRVLHAPRWAFETGAVRAARFSPDSRFLATANEDWTSRVWQIDGQEPGHPFRGHDDEVDGVAFSPGDGRLMVSASADGTARIWAPFGLVEPLSSVTAPPALAAIEQSPKNAPAMTTPKTPDTVFRVAFSNTMPAELHPPLFLVAATRGGTAKVWSWPERLPKADLSPAAARPADAGETTRSPILFSAAFDGSGQFIAAAGEDGTVSVWDWSRSSPMKRYRPSAQDVAPWMKWLEAYSAYVGDPPTSRWPRVYDVAFSKDRTYLAAASEDGYARVWLASSPGEEPGMAFAFRMGGAIDDWSGPRPPKVLGIAFSPRDVNLLATASEDALVRLWHLDQAGGAPVELKGHRGKVFKVAFSPDGEHVVAVGADQTAIIWSSYTGQLERKLVGHTDDIYGVGFSADGEFVVTASWDGRVRIWNWKVSDSRSSFQETNLHGGQAYGAVFAPGDRQVVAGTKDGVVRVLPCRFCVPLAELKEIARQRLAAEDAPKN